LNAQAQGALAGVRVLDLTTVLMGPFAAQMLGDMGADVIKIESPLGDLVRGIGPARHPGMGTLFLQANRSKRSLVLDLKREAGRHALLRLAEKADVLLYNIRPQAMTRLRLSHEDLAAVNPRLIYAGLFGYNQAGPYAARPAYDDLIQGAVALPALVGAIVAALFHCQRSGRGQRLDVPMFETMAQLVLGDHMGGRLFEPPIGPSGYKRSLSPARMPYRTKDGHICVLVYNDKQWRNFFAAIGRPELPDADARFKDMASRTIHIDELCALVADVLTARTSGEWFDVLAAADIPVMPLHTLDSLIDDPHLSAVGFFQNYEHPSEGTIRSLAAPTVWSETPAGVQRPAPRLGEQSVEVLTEAGYARTEIDALMESGVTVDGR
jgi:crotonobetainyl-CoA:carnitine CoA-transferase CaiB-like acyl-CoA transferase